MSIRSDAADVLAAIDRLAAAYFRNRGGVMASATITRRQFKALKKALENEDLANPDLDIKKLRYNGIQLKVI